MANDESKNNILVLGCGNFGTCLAQHLAEQGYSVTLWCHDKGIADKINETHKNPECLDFLTLSPRLVATSDLDANVLAKVSTVVQGVPTQFMRSVLARIAPYWSDDKLLICAAKGIELESLKLPGEIIADVLGEEASRNAAFLSGPSFAVEVAQRMPTCVTIASHSVERANWAQTFFHAAHFRAYTSSDPVGVEVAGALKNVVAIASGASVGIGYQMNTRAAVITRGLAEITRIGNVLGANPLTFNGLSGVGDLFLTCSSEKSRNFTVGFRLGKGESIDHIMQTMTSVAEGYTTAKSAYDLCRKLDVESPIIDTVYKVLYEGKPITQAVTDLLTREAKAEFTF